MPIDKYLILRSAFASANQLHSHAACLRGLSGTVKFDTIWQRLDMMREARDTGITPLLDLGGAAVINAVAGDFFAGTPTSTHAAFVAASARFDDFATAYGLVFAGLTPITYSPTTGHGYASIPLVTFGALVPTLDALIAATAPLTD